MRPADRPAPTQIIDELLLSRPEAACLLVLKSRFIFAA
jgi:hypothetical protein